MSDLFVPLEKKVQHSLDILRYFVPEEGYYFANSYGKDSTVCRDLLMRSGVKFDSHHNLTTVDPPELILFGRKYHPETKVHKPKMSMWQLIVKKRMPPTRIVRYCCEYLKENVAESVGRTVITGIRWQESHSRGKRKMMESCTRKFLRKSYLHPIIDWTLDDVWGYIKGRGIPYCSLYDNPIWKRIGCLMCPMAGGKRQLLHADAYPRIRAAYIRAFQAMVDKRKADGMETKWNTGEEVMEWWTTAPVRKPKEPAVNTILDHEELTEEQRIILGDLL